MLALATASSQELEAIHILQRSHGVPQGSKQASLKNFTLLLVNTLRDQLTHSVTADSSSTCS
jgi:hypothetical protein